MPTKTLKKKKTTTAAKKKVVEKKAVKKKETVKKIEPIEEKPIIEKAVVEKKSEPAKPSGKYFYAIGKRKTAVAQVKLYPQAKAEKGVLVNGKNKNEYFGIMRLQNIVSAPLVVSSQEGKFDVIAKVFGGGLSSQAEAIRLGISRALIIHDASLRKSLKSLGFLRRDARKVERKKPGLKKARRAPQWAKR